MKDSKSTSDARSTSCSRKSFEETQQQVARLMEVAGGSANAYDPPLPDPHAEATTVNVKGNPFIEGGPDHGLRVEDIPATPTPVDVPPDASTLEEDVLNIQGSSLGGSYTHAWEDAPGAPESLDPERYEYHAPVESCGELNDVWEALTWTLTKDEGALAQLETGAAAFEKGFRGNWILEDPVKNKRYLLEDGSLNGHLTEEEDYLLWVMPIDGTDQDFGYIHNGYVFLAKQEKS